VRQASGETLIEDRSQPSTLQCEPEVAAGLAAKIPRGFSADIEAIVAIDALAGPASELPLIPSWHSGSMVTVLRGTRRPAAYCVRSTVKEQDLLKAGGQVSPNCRSRLHPARTFATAAALRAGSVRRASGTTARATVRTLRMQGRRRSMASFSTGEAVESGEGNPRVRW
jgi:hypothetical protein